MILSRLLCGDRVRLTAVAADDLPVIAQWFSRPELLRLYDARPASPKSEAELAQWLEQIRKDKNTFAFAIRSLQGDDLVGYLELDGILWAHGVSGFSIVIGDQADWAKGYGSEAAGLALAFAFDELNLHRITATIFDYNERSIALFEKLGFQREGAFREFILRDGQRYDMLLYGLLRHEWRTEHPQ
jgi:RimJ/RimL family protein N-acetyltransferase